MTTPLIEPTSRAIAPAEPAEEVQDPEEVTQHNELLEAARQRIVERSAVNDTLIKELLASRTDSMRAWWQKMDALVGIGVHSN